MKNKSLKKLLAAAISASIIMSMGAVCTYAAKSDNAFDGALLASSTDTAVPYSWYLLNGSIGYYRLNSSTMRVSVDTNASTDVTSIYQDVVVYKNGTEVHRQRHYGSYDNMLNTHLDFSASKGDFFSTYVTHYVSHNGHLDSLNSHEDAYF